MSRFIMRSGGLLLALLAGGLLVEVMTPQQPSAVPSGGRLIEVLGGAANFAAEIASQAGWLILPVAVLWLLIRGLMASAAYVAVVTVGMSVLTSGGMLLSVVEQLMDGTGSGAGSMFTSGSIQLTVTCGALLLVFPAAVPTSGRAWAVAGTAAFVIAFDVIRVLAGAVSPGPVVGGWLIGIGWLGATVWIFREWELPTDQRGPWWYGIPVHDRDALALAPMDDRPLPGGRSSALKLAGIWLLIAGSVAGAGLLMTRLLPTVQRMDEAAVQRFAAHRTDTLNTLATVAGSFGTTSGIVGVLLVTAALALAITRRAAPTVFLLVAVIGETALYLISGMIVGRSRPDVDHLTEGLPPTSSFPSGHVAAAVVMYGGLALLIGAWSQSRLRYLGFILAPLIVLGVALSRVYWGVHYPTDAVASVIFAVAWLAACWRFFEPARGSPNAPSSVPRSPAATSTRKNNAQTLQGSYDRATRPRAGGQP